MAKNIFKSIIVAIAMTLAAAFISSCSEHATDELANVTPWGVDVRTPNGGGKEVVVWEVTPDNVVVSTLLDARASVEEPEAINIEVDDFNIEFVKAEISALTNGEPRQVVDGDFHLNYIPKRKKLSMEMSKGIKRDFIFSSDSTFVSVTWLGSIKTLAVEADDLAIAVAEKPWEVFVNGESATGYAYATSTLGNHQGVVNFTKDAEVVVPEPENTLRLWESNVSENGLTLNWDWLFGEDKSESRSAEIVDSFEVSQNIRFVADSPVLSYNKNIVEKSTTNPVNGFTTHKEEATITVSAGGQSITATMVDMYWSLFSYSEAGATVSVEGIETSSLEPSASVDETLPTPTTVIEAGQEYNMYSYPVAFSNGVKVIEKAIEILVKVAEEVIPSLSKWWFSDVEASSVTVNQEWTEGKVVAPYTLEVNGIGRTITMGNDIVIYGKLADHIPAITKMPVVSKISSNDGHFDIMKETAEGEVSVGSKSIAVSMVSTYWTNCTEDVQGNVDSIAGQHQEPIEATLSVSAAVASTVTENGLNYNVHTYTVTSGDGENVETRNIIIKDAIELERTITKDDEQILEMAAFRSADANGQLFKGIVANIGDLNENFLKRVYVLTDGSKQEFTDVPRAAAYIKQLTLCQPNGKWADGLKWRDGNYVRFNPVVENGANGNATPATLCGFAYIDIHNVAGNGNGSFEWFKEYNTLAEEIDSTQHVFQVQVTPWKGTSYTATHR